MFTPTCSQNKSESSDLQFVKMRLLEDEEPPKAEDQEENEQDPERDQDQNEAEEDEEIDDFDEEGLE